MVIMTAVIFVKEVSLKPLASPLQAG